VRTAALIALDQMDGSPLRAEQAVAFVGAPEKELRNAALFVVSHHPDWAGSVLRQIELRIRDRSFGVAETEPVRDALLAFAGDAGAQKLIAGLLRDNTLGERQTLFLLDTIDGSALKQFPPDWVDSLGALLGSHNRNVELRALDLVRSRGIGDLDPQLTKIADDADATDQCRVAALAALAPRLTSEHYHFLMSRLDPKTDAILRQSAAQALARCTPEKDDLLLLARKYLPRADPLTLSTALECFRNSKDDEVGAALVALLKKSPAALGTLGEDRVKGLLGGYPESVRAQSEGLLRTLREAKKGQVDRLRKLEPLLTAGGDTGRGRRIFFGDIVACYSCHTIGTEGGHVGPDLTGIGAIRSGPDLLEAIVFPSASFVPGHEVYNVDTQNERLAGVIRSQSADAVVLVTGPNGEVRIPRSKIRKIERSNVSLMPEGFDETLSKSQLTDLLAFLQAEKTRPK
jgi:putative heme-binding domain-containing protein